VQGYAKINLRDLVAQMEDKRLKELIEGFSCSLNKDVEDFIHSKAIEFEKQGLASTYLVFASYQDTMCLAGYFALAPKTFHIDLYTKRIGSSLRHRVNRFATYDEKLRKSIVTAPLIAQLAKNYTNNYDKLITGDELLKIACDTVKEAQLILGGRLVYLECEDTPSLVKFYQDNGFRFFGKRDLESVEKGKFKSKYLLQLLKYLR